MSLVTQVWHRILLTSQKYVALEFVGLSWRPGYDKKNCSGTEFGTKLAGFVWRTIPAMSDPGLLDRSELCGLEAVLSSRGIFGVSVSALLQLSTCTI